MLRRQNLTSVDARFWRTALKGLILVYCLRCFVFLLCIYTEHNFLVWKANGSGCYRNTLWIFWGLAGWKLRLRPWGSFTSSSSSVRRAIRFTWFSEPNDTSSLHATCPSVYGTWQSEAVTHPIMNRLRRCLTSVIEPTTMSERPIPYVALSDAGPTLNQHWFNV